MWSTIRTAGSVVLVIGCVSFLGPPARAADTILADWENNGPTGTGGTGTDFDPAPIDATASCTGCWFKGASTFSGTLGQSTVGVTHGAKSLQISMIGKGNGGGSGLQDTHFDTGATVIWSGSQSDPRFTSIKNAVLGNQGLFTVDVDITYDIPALRALDWLGPPVDFPAKPTRFIGLGLYTTDNGGDPYTHVLEQVLPTLIDPFAAQWNGVTYLTRHVSIPLTSFNFSATNANNPALTFYQMGFSLNGNWGTNPAASNTEAASFYVDNMVLKQFVPYLPIDYNSSGAADIGDWNLFMAQYLKTSPPVPPNASTSFDLVGIFGAAGMNNKVDFADLQEFQRLYHLANPGSGSLANAPEPSVTVLSALALGGIAIRRRSRGK